MSDATVKLTLLQGVEGMAVYLDNTRIAGPKPWGGGQVMREWEVRVSDVADIVRRAVACACSPDWPCSAHDPAERLGG